MKHTIFFFALGMVVLAFTAGPNPLTGKWIHKNSQGEVTEKIEFKSDGTFVAVIPSEQFTVGGKYKMDKHTMMVNDTSCNALYWGKYKVQFMGKDSVMTEAIEDTCQGRRMSADHTLFTRE